MRNYGSDSGALRGMGRSAVPMILSIIGTVGTRIVWIFWIFPYHRSLDILFLSYPVSWILTILMQVICFFIVRKSVHADMKTLRIDSANYNVTCSVTVSRSAIYCADRKKT